MSYDPRWNLRWIEAARHHGEPLAFKVAGRAIVYAGTEATATGFTVFDPRDFNAAFVERLRRRVTESATPLHLVLPDFLKHRVNVLVEESLRKRLEIRFSAFICVQQSGATFGIRDQIRVVSVDDSPVILKFLRHHMVRSGYLEMCGEVRDPKEATATILDLKPDVVTLDIQMPGMTGVEVLRDLLGRAYFPVLMISSLSLEDGSVVFDALNSGAFDYLQKPRHEDKDQFAEEFALKVLAAATDRRSEPRLAEPRAEKKHLRVATSYDDNLLWVMGASTGGPQALTRVLTSMPTHIPPTLIVQHIPPVYSKAFAHTLNDLCPFTVQEANDGDEVQADHVYIAAGGRQMGLVERQGKLFISITDDAPVNRFRPSVDYLFKRAAQLKGRRIVAALMTGMGCDGAQGMLELKRGGARTVAQDEASSAVYGMPRAAVELGAVDRICPLDEMTEAILALSQSESLRRAG